MAENPNHEHQGRIPGEAGVRIIPSKEDEEREAQKASEKAYKDRQLEIDNSQLEVAKSNRDLTRALAVFTLLGVIAGGIQACFANRSVEIANRSAKSAERSAYESCRASQISRAAFLQSIQTGQDTHDAARATSGQTLVSSQSEASDVNPSIDPPVIEVGRPIKVFFHVRNLGKSRATHVITHLQIMFVGKDDDAMATYPIGRSAIAETPVLFANSEVSAINGVSVSEKLPDGTPKVFTPQDASDLEISQKDLLSFVKVTYIDVFGVFHWVHFCRAYPSHNSIIGQTPVHERCIRYNGTDHNTFLSIPTREFPKIEVPEIACVVPKPEN